MYKRPIAILAAVAALTFVSGCGDDEPDAGDTGVSAPANEETTDPADEETSEEESPADGGGVLTAMVGEEDDPDAFVITLTDESGAEVTELPAGDYTIEVMDPSAIHNFHLMGGSVDESTSVEEVTEVTWEVTLEAGDYEFVCDPHPNMRGGFTVT